MRIKASLFKGNFELDVVPTVGALINELFRVNPRDLSAVTAIHQRRKQFMVAIPAYFTGFMGVYLEFVTDFMACTAAFSHVGYLCYVDRFTHFPSRIP
jgi:hypothetical protein